ncbi:unnamed protein product [Phaedon cochleariae]|uniref:ferroxidase n=1 Tax=Phaedon cochleariae TaxID=80249 RepID=A0A9P0GPT1_PHACE|nr:unnamed protein product [Phaedon cochleariae]
MMNMLWSRPMGILFISRLSIPKMINVKYIQTTSTKVSLKQCIRQVICNNYLQRQPFYLTINEYSDKHNHNTDATEDNLETSLETVLYERICSETLDSLMVYFEELAETKQKLANAEVSYSSGVLNINLGEYGTYVINRQSPNKQIWLSSPVSGPKRFDFIKKNQCWVYKRDSITLHKLLESEISAILGESIDMSKCAYTNTNC